MTRAPREPILDLVEASDLPELDDWGGLIAENHTPQAEDVPERPTRSFDEWLAETTEILSENASRAVPYEDPPIDGWDDGPAGLADAFEAAFNEGVAALRESITRRDTD